MVAQAGKVNPAAGLERERMRLEHTVTLLRRDQAQLEASVQQLKNQRDAFHSPQSAYVDNGPLTGSCSIDQAQQTREHVSEQKNKESE